MSTSDDLLARLDKRVANTGTEHPDAAACIRAQAARIAELEKALLHIANPVDWERNNLRQGYELNVPMLLSMIDKPQYYKDVASKALRAAEEGGRMKLPTELAEAILAREGPVNGQISALEAASIEAVVRDIAKFLHDNGGNGGILGIGTNTGFRLSAAILARYGLGE